MSTDRDGDSGEVRTPMALPAALGAFLFAEAGAGPGGMGFTALSALARLGLDPWDEAGRLSKLRDADAIGQLARCLAALPGAPLPDPAGAARRLVALLPGRGAPPPSPVRQPTSPDLREAQRQTVRLAVVVILTVLGLLLTGYAATVVGKAPAGNRTASASSNPGMPAFRWKLSDAEVAAVATYLRTAWGNGAASVGADSVRDLRDHLR